MSGFLAGQVWRSDLNSNVKPLAACLANFANDDGDGVFPSNEYLQWLLGWGESTVRSGISSLKRDGILVPIRNEKGGRGKIPVYRIEVEKLPDRMTWKELKRGQNLSPLPERGQNPEQKGPESSSDNKEETLDRSIALVLSSPSVPTDELKLESNPTPPRKKKQSTADPRHHRFMELIDRAHKHFVRVPPVLNGGAGKNLQRLLKDCPKLDEARFVKMLEFYHQSDDHAPAESPMVYIPKLPRYETGSLNKFGRSDAVS